MFTGIIEEVGLGNYVEKFIGEALYATGRN
jgi:hypothetical protein